MLLNAGEKYKYYRCPYTIHTQQRQEMPTIGALGALSCVFMALESWRQQHFVTLGLHLGPRLDNFVCFTLFLSFLLPAGMYFSCIMFMVSSSCITTILILNYHHRLADTHEMPGWVQTVFLQWLPWLLHMSR